MTEELSVDINGISPEGVSVVICCYNSSWIIEKTLNHLLLQQTDSALKWEIIIVNNNSTDDTERLINKFIAEHKFKVPVSIVHEPVAGLTQARKKGASEAAFEFILFCDDDNFLSPNYVQLAFEIMKAHPEAGALGGRIEGVSDVTFPDWWPQYAEGYAVGKQAEISGDISERKYLWGAGIIVRHLPLKQVFHNRFPSLLMGREGGKLTSGDDSEICARLLLMGHKLHYDERLNLKHFIPQKRLTEEYRDKMFQGHWISSRLLLKYHWVIVASQQAESSLLNRIQLFFSGLFQLWRAKETDEVEIARVKLSVAKNKIDPHLGFPYDKIFEFREFVRKHTIV